MDNKIVHAAPVPPFVTFVASAVPMVFDNSMSYYEALCALWKWLQDDVINVINNNATVTEEYIQMTKDLKEYMDNYFDNLDVQEEINNKLDQMAEDGTLEEIMADYLSNKAVWGFDTVEDMQSSTNLINGSYARTYGFYSKNDGGASLYYVTNSGTANGIDTFAVGSLYAHLVIEPEMNIKQLGYKTNDDISSLNFELIPNVKEINLQNITFICTSPLNLPSNIKIKNGKIVSSASICLNINNKENIIIENLEIDGDNLTEIGINITSSNNINLNSLNLHDFERLTVQVAGGIVTNKSNDMIISNCLIDKAGNNSQNIDENNVVRGIRIGNGKNIHIDNCNISNIYDYTKTHGDGIQFLAEDTQSSINEGISNNTITNCRISNCSYRCIKLQQYGITVDNNYLFSDDDSIKCLQHTISVYDNHIKIINNRITHNTLIGIGIGVNNEETTKVDDILIANNYIEHNGTQYQGAITFSPASELASNVIIDNNTFNIKTTTEDVITLYSSYKNVVITNNTFKGGVNFVHSKVHSNYLFTNTRDNLVISNNVGEPINNLVYFENSPGSINNVITNNVAIASSPLGFTSAQNSVRVANNDTTTFLASKIENNIVNDSYIDGYRKYGSTSNRPAVPYNDLEYFDTQLKQTITYYNGSWYLPDGTVSS